MAEQAGPVAAAQGSSGPGRGRVAEVAAVFLKLGTIGFGGPAAHVALMEDELVRRRRWLSRDRFLDLLSATNLIPGPNSTEMAIHLGYLRAGWPGLVAGGACFIAPAMLVVLALAWGYQRYGRLPAVGGLLYGVKPVILAVVIQALWGLVRRAAGTPLTAALTAAVAALALLGIHEVLLLFAAAALLALVRGGRRRSPLAALAALAFGAGPASAAVTAGTIPAPTVSLTGLALIFLKVGSILFGSGYVLLAFLRPDLVERTGWLTDRELLDAIAVGQITPGPVLTTATFIGYLLAGSGGAVLATVAIFLPAFVLVALSGPLVPRLRASPLTSGFLDGANAASVALMAVVTGQLARAAIVDWPSAGLGVAALLLVGLGRVASAWLILGGAAVGAAHVLVG